jgi:hypothetical protein
MKCYNNFNDMFNAQVNNGARMNVFNGVAEASGLKNTVGDDLPLTVCITTMGKDDYNIMVSKQGENKFVDFNSLSPTSKAYKMLTDARIDDIGKALQGQIDRTRTKLGKFDTTRITDSDLQTHLDSITKGMGVTGVTWGNRGSSTPKPAPKPNPNPSPVKDGVKATGIIKSDSKTEIIKFMFKGGVPLAQSYDETGTKTGVVDLEKLFSPQFIKYISTGYDEVAKITDDDYASLLENRFLSGGRELNQVYWVGGDVNCGDMDAKLTTDLAKREKAVKDNERDKETLRKKKEAEAAAKRGIVKKVAHWINKKSEPIGKFLFGQE